ncbi:hypothetical protein JHS3_02590 [Jeongeupia sp. HS-3]|nr:hypothetical protein JHS3_02590 [Jeongeupia sp. HS-3]
MLALATEAVVACLLGGGGRFNVYALPGWGWVGLLLCVVGMGIDRRGELGWQWATLYFAAVVLLDLLFFAVWQAGQRWLPPLRQYQLDWVIFVLMPVWLAFALAFAASRCRGWRLWRSTLTAIVLAGVFLAERVYWADVQPLWLPAADDTTAPLVAERPPRLADETVLYAEPGRLAEALAAIRPGRAGVVENYALLVGGDAGQQVFLREASAIRGRLDQRFDTAGRSVLLANHDRATGELPIATRTSVAAALAAIGEKMNRDEDVLVLYLTSHGSREHEFALNNPPLELAGLTPGWLRQALDVSGVRWRVVIVSACYSGGFVPALANRDTLVMTAAAADRASFGCADENDFTYFGKALYDALGRSRDWREIGMLTREAVAAREAQDGFEPSLPQFSLGSAIAVKLAGQGAALTPLRAASH